LCLPSSPVYGRTRSPGFLFALFTLASRCSLIQLRLSFQGLGAACHKPYKPSKAIAGPGVPAGLWPDCWGCGCWPGWRSADCACADQKSTRPRRWAAGSRWRRWSSALVAGGDRARPVHRVAGWPVAPGADRTYLYRCGAAIAVAPGSGAGRAAGR
jgi:hypothetical protein